MKKLLRSIILFALTSSAFLISSCDHKKTHDQAIDVTGPEADKYVCPMHPDVTGKKGDTCPKCGMKLELVTESKEVKEYFMVFKAIPEIEANKPAILSLTPSIKGHENETVSLDVQHDKKIHLIVVSKDLSYFDHIHPEPQADGSYHIKVLAKDESYSKGKFQSETRFNQGGDYVLFADYLPSGADHQLDRGELHVAGTPFKDQHYTAEKLTSTTDGYEVSLVTESGNFFSEGTSHISAIVKKGGKEIPADQLEDYLSAKAHIVVISEDTQNYLHVHPNVAKGRLDLHTTFGKAGIFRGWLQFKTEGQVHTADFVINVQEGMTPGAKENAHHH